MPGARPHGMSKNAPRNGKGIWRRWPHSRLASPRERRPFGHRVHTICRPYEKTGRPVRERRLRIPCGLLKQLLLLSLFSLSLFPSLPRSRRPGRRGGGVPVPKRLRPGPRRPAPSSLYLLPHAGQLSLSFLSRSKIDAIPDAIEARQRGDRPYARRIALKSPRGWTRTPPAYLANPPVHY